MHFAAETWLFALLLLPLLWLAVRAADRRGERRARTLLGDRAAEHREHFAPRARTWRRFLFAAGLVWLVVALARPQWGASEVSVTQRGHDVVVALDVSNSMLAEDVTPSRLERAKAELTTFLRAQERSRVGLVLFAGAAFVQCPLTADHGTAEIFLQMAAPDMISTQGTALASALQVGRELLLSGRPEGGRDDFQAILLVTDGEDLEGDWEAEARACRDAGITVIPVGIGEPGGGLIPVTDAEGNPDGFLKGPDGQLVLSRLDLASLERLAQIGGGSTFRVGLDGLAGERLRSVLARLGEQDFEQRQVTRWQERYPWFLGLALLHLTIAALVRPRRERPPRPAVAAAPALALALGLGVLAAPGSASAQLLEPEAAAPAERGRQAYRAGDWAAALQEFETARALRPDDARLSLAVGESLFRLGRHEDAAREFARARQLTDDPALLAESLYNAGTTALARGRTDEAVEHLRESLRLDPRQPDARQNLEVALRRQQQQQQQQQQRQQEGQEGQQGEQGQQGERDQRRQQGERDQRDDRGQQPRRQQQDQRRDGQQEQRRADDARGERQDERQDERQEERQDRDGPQDASPQQPPADRQPGEPAGADSTATPPPGGQEGQETLLTEKQLLQLLEALDRDEQELKRAVQRRLRGGEPESGKRW